MDNKPGSSKSHNFSQKPASVRTDDGESQQNEDQSDDYFMEHALLAKEKSTEKTQVGACLVSQSNQVVGIGYNRIPKSYSSLPLTDDDEEEEEEKEKKKKKKKKKKSSLHRSFYVCHAEINAVSDIDPSKIKNGKLYVTLFPCNECAKLIIKLGISEVIYPVDEKRVIYLDGENVKKNKYKASENMLNEAKIILRELAPRKEKKTDSTENTTIT